MREYYSLHLAIGVGIFVLLVILIFALLQSPELLFTTEWKVQDIPHPIEGYEQCITCHGLDGEWPYPKNHQGWSVQSCTRCHFPADENNEVFWKELMESIDLIYYPVKSWETRAICIMLDSELPPSALFLRTTSIPPADFR